MKRKDIDLYRKTLSDLGGEATLEQIVERVGTDETDIYYIASYLIVPEPTDADPSALLPFALSAVWKPSV